MRTSVVAISLILVGANFISGLQNAGAAGNIFEIESEWKSEWKIDTLASHFLKQQDCYSSERSFAGCVAALESLILAIPQGVARPDEPLFATLNRLITEIPRPKLSELRPSLRAEALDRFRKDRRAAVKKIFSSNDAALRFDEMALTVAPLIAEQNAMRAATIAANDMFEVAAERELGYEIRRKFVEERTLSDTVFTREQRDDKEHYGYFRLEQFDADGCASMKWKLEQAPEALQGWILDLRGNPGGFRDVAVCIVGLFLGKEKLVAKSISLDGMSVKDSYPTVDRLTELPLVVLVDGDSASASELTAGALQDHERAWIIGDRTFGKGTMQESEYFASGLDIVKTTGRFFLPSGRTPQISGIMPDFEIESFPGASKDDRFYWREETLYEYPLPAMGERWTQPRAEAVKKIEDCLSKEGIAKTLYSSQPDDRRFVDYPTLAAEDILHCASRKSGGWSSFWPF